MKTSIIIAGIYTTYGVVELKPDKNSGYEPIVSAIPVQWSTN